MTSLITFVGAIVLLVAVGCLFYTEVVLAAKSAPKKLTNARAAEIARQNSSKRMAAKSGEPRRVSFGTR
jgi:predicted metal-dependent TIM-barrel fold hydrolase